MTEQTTPQVIVIGGGLAGLSTTMRLAEQGCHVKLISLTHVKRSHSVCAQGGINAAMNERGEDDSPYIHAYETLKGGDFLADQPPVIEMCLAGPGIIRLLDRLGCPFNRTPEGDLAFRRFGGTLYNRTAFCGSSTGQQILYALDEQVRRWEVKGQVQKYEHHEFLRLVRTPEGRACGIVMMNLFNLKLEILKADAVVVASGGAGLIFKYSTNSTLCSGAANGRLYMQGMHYANGEFIQIHPTAIPGEDKLRLITETARGEGARLWVYGDASKMITTADGRQIPCGKTGEPWYFLEELYPAYGNLVPRDIASRELLRITEMGLGIDGQPQVYLDLSHLPEENKHRLESVLDIYKKFTGEDPRKVPMRIFIAVHYTMGGAWVDWPAANDPDRFTRYRQMTNIPGLFNVGESDFAYHGSNRLGGNSLMSCIFGGLVTGLEVPRYIAGLNITGLVNQSSGIPAQSFRDALSLEEDFRKDLFSRHGSENVHCLHDELAEVMIRQATVRRDNNGLKRAMEKIKEVRERYQHISLDDHTRFANQTYAFAHRFCSMLELALVIVKGALLRDESRGAHYKPEFPQRNDETWLKTTIAEYDAAAGEPRLSYRPVDTRHLSPTARDYAHAQKETPAFQNIPTNIKLPI